MIVNRTEVVTTYPLDTDKVVTIIVRDKIAPDDVLVNYSRAYLLARRTDDVVDTVPLSRSVKDLMIKSNLTT